MGKITLQIDLGQRFSDIHHHLFRFYCLDSREDRDHRMDRATCCQDQIDILRLVYWENLNFI